MTLSLEKIGDKGQRFEVRATGYPSTNESTIGYADTRRAAENLADGIAKAPGCVHTRIIDRAAQKKALLPVYLDPWRIGVLRSVMRAEIDDLERSLRVAGSMAEESKCRIEEICTQCKEIIAAADRALAPPESTET